MAATKGQRIYNDSVSGRASSDVWSVCRVYPTRQWISGRGPLQPLQRQTTGPVRSVAAGYALRTTPGSSSHPDGDTSFGTGKPLLYDGTVVWPTSFTLLDAENYSTGLNLEGGRTSRAIYLRQRSPFLGCYGPLRNGSKATLYQAGRGVHIRFSDAWTVAWWSCSIDPGFGVASASMESFRYSLIP